MQYLQYFILLIKLTKKQISKALFLKALRGQIIRWQIVKKQIVKGQIVLELLWLAFFAFAFLLTISTIYEKGQKQIKSSQIISHKNKNKIKRRFKKSGF